MWSTTASKTILGATAFGVLFGGCFPVVAFLLELAVYGALDPGLLERLLQSPTFLIVCTAPLVLGFCFHLIGRKQSSLKLNLELVEQAKEKNRKLASLDMLTQQRNRLSFKETVRSLLRTRKYLTSQYHVLLIDLDNFKFVNDTMSHNAGDALLNGFCRRLERILLDDGLLFRLGGDEFAVIKFCDTYEADQLARAITGVFQKPFTFGQSKIFAGGSVGISCLRDCDTDETNVLFRADLALRSAKQAFGNAYVFFEDHMETSARERAKMEAELQQALQEQDQIHLVFQPIMNAGTLEIQGCEALARWDHPERGAICPAEFIPIAESSGLILPLGDLVLRKACEAAQSWPSHITVAVNVSAEQFKNRNYFNVVSDILKETGLNPRRLCLEITESLFIQDLALVQRTLKRLRSLGIQFFMDDFGTGFSSINHLRNLDLSGLKLDRSFVQRAQTSKKERNVIRSVVELGRAFSLNITVEGIETEAQLHQIRRLGVDTLQGFLFDQPMPESQLMERYFSTPSEERARTLPAVV